MSKTKEIVIKPKDIKLTDNILDLFNGNSTIYIQNPWFGCGNVSATSFEDMLKFNSKIKNKYALTPPKIYCIKNKEIYSDFYLIPYENYRTCKLFRPEKEYKKYFNRLMIGMGDYTNSKQENVLFELEHKLNLAIEFLLLAKLFNITHVTSEESLYNAIKSKFKKMKSYTDFKNSGKRLLELVNFRDLKRSDAINTELKNVIANYFLLNNNLSSLTLNNFKSFYVSNKDSKQYLSSHLYFFFSEELENRTTRLITKNEDDKPEMKAFNESLYNSFANGSHKSKFLLKLIYSVSRTSTGYLNHGVNFVVAQCIIDSKSDTTDSYKSKILLEF